MLKLFKNIKKNFSTLIIPDPNSQSQDVKSLLTAAKNFSDPIDILQLSQKNSEFQNFYKEFQNKKINNIFLSEHKDFDGKSYETTSYYLEKFLEKNNYKKIIMSNTFIAKEILPRLSVKTNSQAITDIIEIQSENTFIRPIYAGNALCKIKYDHSPLYISIRTTNFPNSPTEAQKQVSITELDPSENLKNFEKKIQIIENQIQKSERPELTSAKIVISGGRAFKNKENFEILYKLADKLEGSNVGASRAAVDAGFVSNDLQIGQTGKIVAPDLYLAFGISGAIQHVAGIMDSKCIVAINKNKEEPIFGIADYGLVGDIFKIVPELIEKL